MTAWTTPTTWSSGNTPTAANFNTQIRDNMLHIRENIDAIGYGFSGDPRINLVGAYYGVEGFIAYMRGLGHCQATRAIRVYVVASSGNIDLGFYENAGTGMNQTPVSTAAAIPGVLKDSAGETAMPAIGVADVLLSRGNVEFVSGDWLAYGSDTGTSAQSIYSMTGTGSGRLGGGVGWYTTGKGHTLSSPATPGAGTVIPFVMLAIP